ncbi:hypothetical protein GALMADRAFT_283609 [Galerina marginata CBS 339.88]|uniref:C2H2-type domain-containing protein n=1 Tax=Galerina marginata (strain CBS 339.88) TaxID=685588 RepID=A0A067SBC5_GALM3|nr:hypothetical protein GALMADRAFT_283609 [Galerina marginata CBS 339.88]
MPSLSVRAVPGWSVIISSEDLSLDASTLKFHVDQTGDMSFSQDVNNAELFLNISCESFGPNGCNGLRISIEEHEAPHIFGHNALDFQTSEASFVTPLNHDPNIPSFLFPQVPTAPIQLPENTEHCMTTLGVSLFDFDWSTIPASANVCDLPVPLPERTENMDAGYYDYVGTSAVRNTFPGIEGMDECHRRTSPHQSMTLGQEYVSRMLSPPESTACSDVQPEDKNMQSDNDSNDEKDNTEYIDQDQNQEIRSFSSNREAMPTFRGIKPQKKPPRVFTCPVPSCNVKTSRRHDLLRHEVKKHGKKSNWQSMRAVRASVTRTNNKQQKKKKPRRNRTHIDIYFQPTGTNSSTLFLNFVENFERTSAPGSIWANETRDEIQKKEISQDETEKARELETT